ncbi:single-stranded DNA-binding protein [Micromonospora sp. NPDC000207]|uniref:single-stranded DNA-binding protein n=1 Tax=Micromonospora sp. NPDC000207 TaxID=3154246 RepID=UPI003319A0F0
MNDTHVTIIGNVLTAPQWRRTAQSGTLVANFKVASTARRLDKDSGRWVDGNSLRVRVNCWRKLAEGVAASVMVGDPVVVAGRLYTRDWTDEAGNHRTLYELEAVAVGHDLARGRSRFVRNRPTMTTSSVADAETENRVHGEPTRPVPDEQAPTTLDDRPYDEEFELPSLAGVGRGPSPLDLPPHPDFGRSRAALDPAEEDLSPVGSDDDDEDLDDSDHLAGTEQADADSIIATITDAEPVAGLSGADPTPSEPSHLGLSDLRLSGVEQSAGEQQETPAAEGSRRRRARATARA